MTREEALDYCAEPSNGVFYSPELGILFSWLAYMREDLAAAKALGASICVVPTDVWTEYEKIDLDTLAAALLRGDIHVRT